MNPIANALMNGFTAKEVIDFLVKSNKELAPKINKAIEQGYTPEQIVKYLGGYQSSKPQTGSQPFAARSALKPGYTEQERARIASEYRPPLQRNVGNVLGSAIENAPMLAGVAGLTYGFGRAAAPVAQVIGNYLSQRFGGPRNPTQPTTPGGGPQPQPGPAPVQPPPAGPTPAGGGGAPPSPGTGPQPSPGLAKKTGFLSSIVQGVAGVFGFRNKPLVNAVATIVEKTGQEVSDVYKELSQRFDVSTPEKATQAALNKLREIQEGQTAAKTPDQIVQEKEQETKTLERIKPAEEVQKALTKDLKSSVIRKTEYDPAKSLLKVVFNNSHTYTYDDVPEEIYNKLTEGAIPAKTKGENQYGRWWVGKQPSAGAAFNQLIKKAGYNYQRVENTPMSEEEEEEYKHIAGDAKQREKRFSSQVEKATGARKNISKDIIAPDNVKFRAMAYKKTLDELRKEPSGQRNEKLIQTIEDRLKTLGQLDKMKNSKRSKVLTEEVIRFEKSQGKAILKKMLLLLPATVVKVLKDKIENTSEEDILKFIKDYLTKSKK